MYGGSDDWLDPNKQNPDVVPQNLLSIKNLNKKLCHRPWEVTKADLPQDWRESELLHAVLILSSHHAMCGLIFGLAITPEIDIEQKELSY